MDNPVIRWDVVSNDRTLVYAATKSLLQRLHRMLVDHGLKCQLESDHIVLDENFTQVVKSCEGDLSVVLLRGEKRHA